MKSYRRWPYWLIGLAWFVIAAWTTDANAQVPGSYGSYGLIAGFSGGTDSPVFVPLVLTNSDGTRRARLTLISDGNVEVTDGTGNPNGGGLTSVFFSNPANIYTLSSAAFRLGAAYPLGWTSTDGFGVADIGLLRGAAGILAITDGSTGLGRLRVGSHTPSSSSESCTVGDTADDANYHYYCKAANTWVRAAYSTF